MPDFEKSELYISDEEAELARERLALKTALKKQKQAKVTFSQKMIEEKKDKAYLLKIDLGDMDDIAYLFQRLYEQIEELRGFGHIQDFACSQAHNARFYLQNFLLFAIQYKPEKNVGKPPAAVDFKKTVDSKKIEPIENNEYESISILTMMDGEVKR